MIVFLKTMAEIKEERTDYHLYVTLVRQCELYRYTALTCRFIIMLKFEARGHMGESVNWFIFVLRNDTSPVLRQVIT